MPPTSLLMNTLLHIRSSSPSPTSASTSTSANAVQSSLLQSQSSPHALSRTTVAIIAGTSGILLVLFSISLAWLVRRCRRRRRIRERRKTRLAQRQGLKEFDYGIQGGGIEIGRSNVSSERRKEGKPQDGKREQIKTDASRKPIAKKNKSPRTIDETAFSPIDVDSDGDAWEKHVGRSGGNDDAMTTPYQHYSVEKPKKTAAAAAVAAAALLAPDTAMTNPAGYRRPPPPPSSRPAERWKWNPPGDPEQIGGGSGMPTARFTAPTTTRAANSAGAAAGFF